MIPRLPDRFWFLKPFVVLGRLGLLLLALWAYIHWTNTVPAYRRILSPLPNPNGP